MDPAEMGRSPRPLILLGLALLIAGLVLFFPFPTTDNLSSRTFRIVKSAWSHPAAIAVFGNSVVDHVSKCDVDKRSLPVMIAETTGIPTLDISFAGQRLDETLDLAALALKSGGIRRLVVFISVNSMQDRDSMDLQSILFFGVFGARYFANDVFRRGARGVGILRASQVRARGFSYKGVKYPDYAHMAATFFARERDAEGCPEQLGVDHRSMEANYWRSLVSYPLWAPNVTDIHKLVGAARTVGKPISIVILPVDFQDMDVLNPQVARAAAARRDEMVAALNRSGVRVVDASAAVRRDGFSDRYCACGHLNERGRQALVEAIKTEF